ncbi:cytochrome P450 [Streptomyces sp. HNM0574]|nr:cytochrome P450 [Streptomyces sp. HNM0574]
MEPELLADPFAGYGALRERGPVLRGRYLDDTPVWLVTRFEEVRSVLRDQRFVNSVTSVPGYGGDDPRARLLDTLGFPEHMRPYMLGSILDTDPPDHTRLRRLVSRAFTARRMLDLRPRVEQIADELLDGLPEQAEDGVVDLVERYAYPLPVTVICELVGIPEAVRPRWREWSGDLVSMRPDRIGTAVPAMVEHIHELIAERRSSPADDLVSALVQAHDEGGRLSDNEMVTLVLTLVLAGHETTANLIANGAEALLAHPAQLRLLRDDPGLWPRAVHELMRWCGPVHATQLRYATEDVELGGVRISKGEAVQPMLVGANFDPRHYAEPDRLDVTRQPQGRAEDHVGFGHGMHYCLGATLARQEGEVALAKLFARHPDLSPGVPPGELRREPVPGFWRLASLPLRLSGS